MVGIVRQIVSVSEMLTRLTFLRLFSLLLYDFFSSSPLKPCGYFTCLIMITTRPVLTQPLDHCIYDKFYLLCNDLPDLRASRTCKLTFPSAGRLVDVAGDGSTKTNIKMNTKWLYVTHPVLTQPLHHCMTRFKLWSPWPSSVKDMQTDLSFCRFTVYVAGDLNGSTQSM
jgi:hypothetical protein